MKVIVVGATGLCSTAFLRKALDSPQVNSIFSFSRNEPHVGNSDKLTKVVEENANEWHLRFPKSADVIFSGVATTRAAAGGLDKQRLIDHDLQVQLAKEAREKGCKTFILVSSAGASASSMLPYLKMKGETEEAIVKLGFEKTIILRPGPLLGQRESNHRGFAGGSAITNVVSFFHRSYAQSLAMYPVHADEVAGCALDLAQRLPDGVHYIESKDILANTDPSKRTGS